MRPGDADVEPEWVWVLLSSTKLLTVGSLLLLAGPLSILGLGRFPSVFWVYGFLVIAFLVYGLYILILTFLGAFVLTVIGVLSHLTAWAGLSESADLTRSMRLAFRLSIVGFVAGVLFVTIQTPSPGLFLLFGGWIWFPFLPIVYGPVVIAHAILFLLASGKIRPPYRRHLVAGSAILLVIALTGLWLQFSTPNPVGSGFIPAWATTLAGFTFVGYGLVTLGLSRDYERRLIRLGASPWNRAFGAAPEAPGGGPPRVKPPR